MERSGPSFFEGDDDENDLNPVEADPPQLSFTERLKEIFDIEDDDEEDETDGKKKKGLFKRLFSKVPGVVDIDKAEEAPEAPERSFSLPFLSAPEAGDEEPLVEPHHVEPALIHPETTDGHSLPEEPSEEDPVQPLIRQNQPLQQQATNEAIGHIPEADEPDESVVATTPATYGAPPPMPGPGMMSPAEYATADTSAFAPTIETDDFATHREVTRKATVAGAVGVGAAIIANSRAKSRERDLEERSEDRQEKLKKTIEANQQAAELRLANLRQKLEAERDQPSPIHRSAERPQIQSEPQPPPYIEQAPKPQPSQETYSPDVHDRISPKVAFEKLTGMEQPLPRSLEQERRHEVKDDPSKVPVSYTQIDQDSTPGNSHATGRHATRSNLMSLNPMLSPASQPPVTKKTTSQVYKKAIISGALTAVVILAVVVALALTS